MPFALSLSKGELSKSKPPGVARQQVTFLVLPRKVTQRSRPRFAAPTGYPALLGRSGLLINSHDPLRGHVLKHIRRTTPDQPALLGGAQGRKAEKPKTVNPHGGQQVAHHAEIDRQYNSSLTPWSLLKGISR